MKYTFSYIVQLKGGTYCSQVASKNLEDSLQCWLMKITNHKEEIKFLGEKTLDEIRSALSIEDCQPVMLNGLKNIWYLCVPTRQGALHIHVVRTEVS